jgi:hypothetical protein
LTAGLVLTAAPTASGEPIYVSIVMRNEEPVSGQYPDFVKDAPAFLPFLACADGNLLANCGFESGTAGQPDAWSTFTLPGGTGTVAFAWDHTYAQGGT